MRCIKFLLVLTLIAPSAARAADEYILQPEDVLSVNVYSHPELSQEVTVLDNGQFDYPIAGTIPAAGKTSKQVASIIASGLKTELNTPQVTVSVKQPALRRVYISGLVGKAGSYDLKPGWRISHLIAEAGGLSSGTSGANSALKPELAKATLVRGDQTLPVDLEAILIRTDRDADLALQPGDLLQIQSNTNLVHVAGQVKSPGDYQVKDKLGVIEAISMAGGATDKAALTRAQVIRDGQVLKVDLYKLLVKGETEGNVELQPGDTVVVPANEARIAVLGGVSQPGYYDLPDGKPVTVVDAVGMAKGTVKYAHVDRVALIRTVGGKQVVSRIQMDQFLKHGDLSQNPTVQPGDVIYIDNGKERIGISQFFASALMIANPFVAAMAR